MDGSDMAFDYKAVAAGIARSEGMGALLPVVEKELLHYRILSAMQDGGFFGPIVFQGGTSLRLCHGSPRYSEDLDFAGGTGFGVDDLRGLGECVRSSLAGMSPDVQVKVREPVRDEGLVRRWRISTRTAAQRPVLGFRWVRARLCPENRTQPRHAAHAGGQAFFCCACWNASNRFRMRSCSRSASSFASFCS